MSEKGDQDLISMVDTLRSWIRFKTLYSTLHETSAQVQNKGVPRPIIKYNHHNTVMDTRAY